MIALTQNMNNKFSSSDYLYLLALKHMNKDADIVNFLNQWRLILPDDPILKWCELMIRNDVNAEQNIEKKITT